jgi:type I restriction enzyme S subunit
MSFPRYKNYKNSGAEWLGEVPAHWQVSAFRRSLASPLMNGIFKKKEDFGSGVLLINVFDIYREDFRVAYSDLDRIRCTSDEQLAYEVIPGDLFFVRSSLKEEGIAAVSVAEAVAEPVVFECHLIRARTDQSLLGGRYCSYLFNSDQYRSEMIKRAKITTMTTIDQEAILSVAVVRPPVEEQGIVAAFLDRETAKIDALVAEQQRLIELLKEKRQAVISYAVTKGLNPAAPMKDSGIKWLGDVPEHWANQTLNSRFSIELGKMLDESRITGRHLVPYLRNTDVQWGAINFEDLPEMDITEGEYNRYTVENGDLLVCEGGEVGRAALVTSKPGVIGFQKALHRFRSRGVGEVPRYMYYTLVWAAGTGVFSTAGSSTIAHLTGEQLRKYRFPKPPLPEQSVIVRCLDDKTSEIDKLTEEAESGIILLQERRTALISAAVTGKIDVRGLVAAQPESEVAA